MGSYPVRNVIDMQATLFIPTSMAARSLVAKSPVGPRDISQLAPKLSFYRDGHMRLTMNELPGEFGTPTILKYDSRLGRFTHSATLANIGGRFPGGAWMRNPSVLGHWNVDLSKLRPEALDRISRHNGEELVLGPEDWVSSSLLSRLP
jgi:hypothetical protein